MPITSADPDDYETFLQTIRDRFASMTGALFSTDATGLWEAFLQNLPMDQRQHHTCHACRRFVEGFGGLVRIDNKGHVIPALWGAEATPLLYRGSVAVMARLVSTARVTGVHVSSDTTYGIPKTGVWAHMAVQSSQVYRKTPLKMAHQVAAEKLEDYGMLSRALSEYTEANVQQAVTLLKSNTLYRGEKCLGVANWLLKLHEERKTATDSRSKENITWVSVAAAPAGFCHVRSTMIGTLLDDLQSGLPFADVSTRFASKMDPASYARAQAGPTATQIAEAEKVVAALDAAGSLSRRYARLEEVQLLWSPAKTVPASVLPATGGVFSHLTPKSATPPAPAAINIPAITMTWDKFSRTVLPDAKTLEIQVPTDSSRFAALVTAANAEAPSMLQWDNSFSWYYHGGIDGRFKQRVEGAGGRYENVDIRATLIWENRNDLDIHVITPNREHVYYGSKQASCGGFLDVDMNVSGETTTPVENIRWVKGKGRSGRYKVYVQNYRFHESNRASTAFEVELEVNGELRKMDGTVSHRGEVGDSSNVTVFEFDFVPGRPPVFLTATSRSVPTSGTNSWGVASGSWAKVSGISVSPNLWNADKPMLHHGKHTFFLLEGCKDEAQGLGRGFFTETLKAEFRPISRTLEAYAATATIEGADTATACGIGMTDQRPWNLTVRVTPKQGASQVYLIDRWD